MFAIVLTKTTITTGSVAATLLVAGGSLSVYKTSRASGAVSANQTDINQRDEDRQNTITPVALPKQYRFAIFEEGTLQKKQSPNTNQLEARCKLEGGTIEEFCSVTQKEVADNKKWINYAGLKALGFISLIPKDHISENINVYKVRVSAAFVNEWANNQEKKLNIFDNADDKNTAKPLITLVPKLAIKTNGNYVGKMQYVVGKVMNFTETPTATKELTTAGKSFTCALPGNTSEVYKNCDFYHLGENDTVLSSFASHQLRTPLTKLTKVEKSFHYLIKFDEPMDIHPRKYVPTGETLKIKVHTDTDRSVVATNGITSIHLQYLSPTVIFDKDNKADLAVIL